MKDFKIILSGESSAVENMAQDEKIFNQYLIDGIGVFRVYRWQKPAFTYGFSQDPHEQIDLDKCCKDGVEVAKRITGGGVLFHHDEITYSFVCRKSDVGQLPTELVNYRNVCKFLIKFYESLGLNPKFAQEMESFNQRSVAHQLCSAANEKYDIVIGDKKIGGNAQKRSREVIFQHGAIPCSINWDFVRQYVYALPKDIAEHVTTLSDELDSVVEKDILEEKLIEAFADTFKIKFINHKNDEIASALSAWQ
ncbi:MAG: lipoate--protein ligase family protein [Candidatus Omnitrophota bacterium]